MEKRLRIIELYSPPAEYGPPEADLVLVHGLDGHPIDTWTYIPPDSPENPVVWPYSLLPTKRPCTRVLSFGYNGDMYRNNSAAGIRGNARALLGQLTGRRGSDPNRPLVFVAHCLGGLIVKQALCFAKAEDEYNTIAKATKHIIFFGTPNFGASSHKLKRMAKDFAPLSLARRQSDLSTTSSSSAGSTLANLLPRRRGEITSLVKAMHRDADQLINICEDFVIICGSYTWTVFWETLHWPGTKRVIVNEESARTHNPTEMAFPVEGDHRSMCQFVDAECEGFRSVCWVLEKDGVLGQARMGGVGGEAATYVYSKGGVRMEVKLMVDG